MAKGPAVVFIARHGARLDAADSSWHLTSPTPYDTPLSYGGWTQGKALGLRIAALLHARKTGDDARKPKRRHRIVLHSSPYLRCIQTSIAIAAGISQFHPSPTSTLKTPLPKSRKPPSTHGPPASPDHDGSAKPHTGPEKILLRIDAFLSEWLSPSYFEDITSPPESILMVKGAKAELLPGRGDYIEEQPNTDSSQGNFPGGWVKNIGPAAAASRTGTHDGSFPTMGSLAQALQHRERSSSQGSIHTLRSGHGGVYHPTTMHRTPDHIYNPPVPSYAVSPAEPIPRGYVAHARDACVQVDFQWDSMRPPLEWGDSGEYGDEWSTMHKRFRKGLAGMMAWYKEHGLTGATLTGGRKADGSAASGAEVDGTEDDDEELVLILVTHGAGCNALVGAIANHPFLAAMGMASLTMAVRRDEPREPSVSSPVPTRRSSVVDVGMANEYDLTMIGSVDHLRPGVDPSQPPQPQSPAAIDRPSPRRRFASTYGTNSQSNTSMLFTEPSRPVNSSLGSIRRTYSSETSSRALSNNADGPVSPSVGLWSGSFTPLPPEDSRKSTGDDMVLNLREHEPASSTTNGNNPSSSQADPATTTDSAADGATGLTKITTNEKREANDNVAPLPPSRLGRMPSQTSKGLWGSNTLASPGPTSPTLWGPPRLDDVAERAHGHKRRWTITEREGDLHYENL